MPFDASEDLEVHLAHNKGFEVDVSKCNPVSVSTTHKPNIDDSPCGMCVCAARLDQ